MESTIGIILAIYLVWLQEQWLFKRTEEYYCNKYLGNCKKCNCWSCKRKEFLDDNGDLTQRLEDKYV